jgi:hypothetical protein|tara:strand:+ start:273 stop:407 length:135 start_codon:yes stop_codon:yes gene_type:complete
MPSAKETLRRQLEKRMTSDKAKMIASRISAEKAPELTERQKTKG